MSYLIKVKNLYGFKYLRLNCELSFVFLSDLFGYNLLGDY